MTIGRPPTPISSSKQVNRFEAGGLRSCAAASFCVRACKGWSKVKVIGAFVRDIVNQPPLTIEEFDDKLWVAAIERVVVGRDGVMLFRFRNGIETKC